MEKAPRYPVELVRVMLVREAPGTYKTRPEIDGPESAWTVLKERLGTSANERFAVLLLDARNRLLGVAEVGAGTLTACIVHPREVFAPAILANAAQILVAHNHPSGDPTPSEEDLHLKERLEEAGRVLGIPVVDFIIVTADAYQSLGGQHGRPLLSQHTVQEGTQGHIDRTSRSGRGGRGDR
jgi:DNA repair protein RadC